jgi:hypothetical protein
MNNNSITGSLADPYKAAPYRIARSLRAASLVWIACSIIYVVSRLDAFDLGPWDSVRVAALIVGPGALGVLISLIVESVRFSDRNP